MAFGTRTWRLEGSGAASSDCTPALRSNKPALVEQVDTSAVTASVSPSGAVRGILSWTTEASDVIGVPDWPLGTYTASLQVDAIPSGDFFGRARMRKVGTACSLVGSVVDSGFFTTTGLYVFNGTFDPGPGDADDRLQLVVEVYFPSGTAGDLTIDVSHADTFIRAPLQPMNPVIRSLAGYNQPIHLLQR